MLEEHSLLTGLYLLGRIGGSLHGDRPAEYLMEVFTVQWVALVVGDKILQVVKLCRVDQRVLHLTVRAIR